MPLKKDIIIEEVIKGVDVLMSKRLESYINNYKYFHYVAGITAGITIGDGFSQNYPGMISSAVFTIIYEIISDLAKKNSSNATEFQLLNNMYKGVLEEVANSIKKLELDDIEGIFAYVCYLYKNNYLSYDRHLPPSNITIFNEKAILAALSLNNHGLCRNKAPMLADLYKFFDIESYILACTRFNNEHIIINLADRISEEVMGQIIANSDVPPKQIFEVLRDIDKSVQAKLEKERKALEYIRTGNHAITQVNSKDHTYLLDPENAEFYIEADAEGRFFSNNGDYFKIVKAKKKKNLYKERFNMEIVDKKPIMGMDEMGEIINKRLKIIKDNKDIVEEMHKEIEPILLAANDIYRLILQAQ